MLLNDVEVKRSPVAALREIRQKTDFGDNQLLAELVTQELSAKDERLKAVLRDEKKDDAEEAGDDMARRAKEIKAKQQEILRKFKAERDKLYVSPRHCASTLTFAFVAVFVLPFLLSFLFN